MEAAQAFNAANAALRAGQLNEALAGFELALRVEATLVPAALGRTRCLVALGRLMPARDAFAQLLRLEPFHYSGWLEAGRLCRQM